MPIDGADKDGNVYVYIDGVDWQHEIGCALGGNRVYPSIKDLKEHSKCWQECGIVRIRIEEVEWVAPQDFSRHTGA